MVTSANERRKPPTIHDVAREAGVSRGTVSRFLNGGHYVSPAAGRSDSVAFLLTEPQEKLFEDPNFNVLLRGRTENLARHDIPLLLMLAASDGDRRRLTRYLTAGHVDGVLLVSSHSGDPVAAELRAAGMPLVACGKPMGLGAKVGYVAADDRDGARDLVRHLVARGRRRIGMITGPLDLPGGTDRLAGYREVLTETGLPYDPALVAEGDYGRVSGERAARRLLRQAPDMDAVFVASDLMAQGVVNALHRLGCSIPEDIAVGGFDDSPAGTAVTPALTTVRQPFERISTEMVRMLLAQIAGEDTAGVILPTELVVRDST